MKKWVKLDRDSLDLGDVGKCVRPFQQEYKVTDILNNGQEVELIDQGGELTSVSNDKWLGTEIEEDDISTLLFPNGGSISFSNSPNVTSAWTSCSPFQHWPAPDRETLKAPAHDCYLSGHKFVDTGMRVSWCSECQQDAVWDQATATFKAVRKA